MTVLTGKGRGSNIEKRRRRRERKRRTEKLKVVLVRRSVGRVRGVEEMKGEREERMRGEREEGKEVKNGSINLT